MAKKDKPRDKEARYTKVCRVCEKVYPTPHRFSQICKECAVIRRRGIYGRQSTGPRSICPICEKGFMHKLDYKRHLLTHLKTIKRRRALGLE